MKIYSFFLVFFIILLNAQDNNSTIVVQYESTLMQNSIYSTLVGENDKSIFFYSKTTEDVKDNVFKNEKIDINPYYLFIYDFSSNKIYKSLSYASKLALNTGGLQEYIDGSSDIEKQDLKEFEVSIEAVDAIRNKKYADRESSVMINGFNSESSVISHSSQYRFQIEDVPWESLAEISLDRKKLKGIGALESLLKGFKTPMLIPIFCLWNSALYT